MLHPYISYIGHCYQSTILKGYGVTVGGFTHPSTSKKVATKFCPLCSYSLFSSHSPLPADCYAYTLDLLQLETMRPHQAVQNPHLQGIHSPLRVDEWSKLLQEHPDQHYVAFLVRGMTFGFRIGFDRVSCTYQGIT